MKIARLENIHLREIWPHEAQRFTKWLAENLDFLSEEIGISLTLVEREASAGTFFADILAEDQNGNLVVIENQLERTNHDHLGKLVTYMSNLETKTAIWITSDPRPEHEKAIHWLNETLPVDTAFYLIKLEAYRIGNSDPAPHLIVVAGPSEEGRQVGGKKKELAERHLLRIEFWKQLLEMAKSKIRLHERISPSKDNCISTSAGISGFSYAYVIRMDDAHVELYINKGDSEENKKIFDTLQEQKDEIEKKFNNSLDWQRLDKRRGSRIRFVINDHGLSDRESWPKLQELMVDAMIRLHNAIQPAIESI